MPGYIHVLRIVQVSGAGGEPQVAIAMVSMDYGDHRDVTDLQLPNGEDPK